MQAGDRDGGEGGGEGEGEGGGQGQLVGLAHWQGHLGTAGLSI